MELFWFIALTGLTMLALAGCALAFVLWRESR
jgi:hypothetical protein